MSLARESNYAARPLLGEEIRLRVVAAEDVLHRVQVIENAIELIEAMDGGQVFVQIAKVVFSKLCGGITHRFEHFRDCRVFCIQPLISAWQTDFTVAGPGDALPGNEGGSACSTTLFGVIVGKHHAFTGKAVNVGSLVPHDTMRIGADVAPADVIAPDNDDVRLLALGVGLRRKRDGGGDSCHKRQND